MPTANEQFIVEMLDAFWGLVTADAEIVAIFGTKIFPRYNGKILPAQEDGSVNGLSLPALYCQGMTLGTDDEDNLTPHSMYVVVELECGVLFADQNIGDGVHSSVAALAALMTLVDTVSTRAVYEGALSPNIDSIDLDFDDAVEALRANDNSQTIAYWDGRVTVTLRRNRPIPAS